MVRGSTSPPCLCETRRDKGRAPRSRNATKRVPPDTPILFAGTLLRTIKKMNDRMTRRVEEIQASMVKSAKPRFDESELGHLRCLVRLAVEFQDYLEHGSVEIARGMQQQPYVGLTSAEFRKDVQNASTDPFNEYDLGYVCESILSGVDSFWDLSTTYRRSVGKTDSKIKWGMVSSRESFEAQFISMFNRFTEEVNFESKCRLLLDLFKLQMVFVGISYNASGTAR